MRKHWKLLIMGLVLILTAIFCTTAMAADAVISSDTAVVTVLDGMGTTATFNAANSEIIDITVTSDGLTAGGQYAILMVKSDDGETYTIDETSILYIDQAAASTDETTGQGTVSFGVYPSAVENSIILITGGDQQLKIATVAPAITKFDLYGASMTLGNDLSMNFYIRRSDLTGSGNYAVITAGGVSTTIPQSQWATNGSYNSISYKGIAAKQMADEITVELFNAKGQAISNVWVDGVRSYAMRMLPKASDTLKTVMVDMLNYGAAAQEQFSYNTADLANNQLTAEQQAYATQSVEMKDYRVKGANYYGSSLALETNIQLVFYFTNVSAELNAKVTFTDHNGNAVSEDKEIVVNGRYAQIVVDELVVADARQLVTVTVTDAGGNVVASASDSVESYCARMASLALREPLMKFAQSAYNQFH